MLVLHYLAHLNQEEQFLVYLYLSTSALKLAKSDFAATLDVLAPIAPFKSAFVAYWDLIQLSHFHQNVYIF